MSLTQILKEFTQKQLKFMQQYGADIVAWEQTNDYELLLFKDPRMTTATSGDIKHQIGFQRKGQEFTDEKQVMNKSIPDNVSISDLRKIEDIIKGWLGKYTKIAVGSNNKEKQDKYKRIFNRLGFNAKETRVDIGNGMEDILYLKQ